MSDLTAGILVGIVILLGHIVTAYQFYYRGKAAGRLEQRRADEEAAK